MFAKRHRRPQEEEPLVPHGLVWQATEEPSSAKEPESQEIAAAPATRLQIVPPPVSVPASESSVQVSPTNVDLGSQRPPFWHKAAKPEVVKPVGHSDDPTISPPASIPAIAADDTEPQKRSVFFRPLDLVADQARRVNRSRRGFGAVAHKLLGRWDGRALVVKFRKVSGAILRPGLAVLVEARGEILARRPWEGLKRRLVWIATLVAAGAQRVGATAQLGYTKLKVNAKAYLSTKHPAVQHDTVPAEPPVESLALHPISQARLKSRTLAGLRLRVAVAFKRFLPGTERLQAIRRDSRLWTSLAMAGLSALLLLGFVLTVRHYATEALPSHVLHKDSLTERAPAEAAGVVPQKPSAPVESARATKQTAAIPPKRTSLPRVIKPKPRNIEDNDYVARDTFVSYENRRNRSR
jgi:hypothetical protein